MRAQIPVGKVQFWRQCACCYHSCATCYCGKNIVIYCFSELLSAEKYFKQVTLPIRSKHFHSAGHFKHMKRLLLSHPARLVHYNCRFCPSNTSQSIACFQSKVKYFILQKNKNKKVTGKQNLLTNGLHYNHRNGKKLKTGPTHQQRAVKYQTYNQTGSQMRIRVSG